MLLSAGLSRSLQSRSHSSQEKVRRHDLGSIGSDCGGQWLRRFCGGSNRAREGANGRSENNILQALPSS